MTLRRARIVFLKEMLETLRDKRTLMVMILGPVLVYPVLILVLVSMTRAQQGKLEHEASRVALVGADAVPELAKRFAADKQIELLPGEVLDPRRAVRSGRVQAAVVISGDVARPHAEWWRSLAGREGRPLARVVVIYNEADERSALAFDRIRDLLEAYSRQAVTEDRAVLAKGEEYAYPLVIKHESVGTPEDVGRKVLGYAIPMMLVLMTIAGSMYPAIDTTAGEKERGTIETLLTTPASIAEIVAGKFLTVFLIAILTGLLNLAGMGLSLAAIGSAAQAKINLSLPLGTALLMVLFLLPLGFLFSAVMMAVAMYARTVKEAQNYATPIYLLSIVPAMMSTLPGFELTPFLALVPVVGVTLLLKELLQGTIVFGHLAIVFLATSLYALGALRLTVRLFHDENVLFSSERPFALFVGRRRLRPRPLPTPGEALLLAAVCFILFFTLGQTVQAQDFRLGTAVTMWLLLFAPALWFARYLKLDLRKTFSLRAPSAAALVGTVVAVAASLVVVFEIEYVQSTLLRYPTEIAEEAERTFGSLSFADLLVFAALFPALCEETLFRGFMLAGMASRLRAWQAALVVGVLFGFFHIGPVAMKVIPVSHIVLGIVLSLLVAYSGSIATGVLFHLLYNGALVAFERFQGQVTWFFGRLGVGGAWMNAEGHVPAVLFVPAVALLVGTLAAVIALGGSRPRV
jgi:sodium transport system permease protein